MELGILRSDYMLDVPSGLPLQVEVNTVSTSFMSLSTRVGREDLTSVARSPPAHPPYSVKRQVVYEYLKRHIF